MLYNYPSCRLDDQKAVKRLFSIYLKSKYWGVFSFQPNTMTCIDDDIKILKKYEPFGLVMYKMGDVIAIPSYIPDMYYDIYKNIVDLLKRDWMFYGENYYIDIEKFKKLMVLDIQNS